MQTPSIPSYELICKQLKLKSRRMILYYYYNFLIIRPTTNFVFELLVTARGLLSARRTYMFIIYIYIYALWK